MEHRLELVVGMVGLAVVVVGQGMVVEGMVVLGPGLEQRTGWRLAC